MRLLAWLIIVVAFLLTPALAHAQTSNVSSQSQPAYCRAAFYFNLNTHVKVTLKNGRKIKGKLIACRDDQFDLKSGNKTETIASTNISRVEQAYRFGRQLKYFAGVTLAIAGTVVASPGLIIAKAGAEDVGLIIAAPGLAIFAAGLILAGAE
jgi:small nuclear ribonucleoprotein (snRNP)-like protein